MNHSMESVRSRLKWPGRLIWMLASTLFLVLSAQAQTDTILPAIGGDGGGKFTGRCPQGEFLAGFELWTGDDVDAIRPTCIPASGPASVGPLDNLPSRFGGDGGSARFLVCPKQAPIVLGMYVNAQGNATTVVHDIWLWCGVPATTQHLTEKPNLAFDGHGGQCDGCLSLNLSTDAPRQSCPSGAVAVGISGR